MNKKTISILIVIIILIVGALIYVLLTPPQETDVEKAATSSTQKEAATNTTPVTSEQPGTYVTYSEAAVQNTAGTKLLFFHAPWCPQCRAMEASIENDGVPSGVTVFKVDYDTHQDLRQKYGVTLQTTFVKIDDNGDKIASYVAYEEPQFSAVKRELLQ